jgi:hypothetical protein
LSEWFSAARVHLKGSAVGFELPAGPNSSTEQIPIPYALRKARFTARVSAMCELLRRLFWSVWLLLLLFCYFCLFTKDHIVWLRLPVQPVGAIPSNQLVRQYFPIENPTVWLDSIRPSQGRFLPLVRGRGPATKTEGR